MSVLPPFRHAFDMAQNPLAARNALGIIGTGGGGGVSSINTMTGAVTIAAGTGINVSNAGTTITISNTAAGISDAPSDSVRYLRRNAAWVSGDAVYQPIGSYLTGNQTITLSGDVTGSGATAITATIANNAVTNAKLADIATARIRGRVTAGTGDPEDLTGTQATTLLDVFTSSLKGLAPSSGGGTTNYLRADATWAAPTFTPPTQPTQTIYTSGSGTYTKPASCTRLEVTLVGGGAGGAGGNAGGVGTAGGNTTFGSLTAGGAGANSAYYASGTPGTASGGTLNITGGCGQDGSANGSASFSALGGMGGATIFGGAGGGRLGAAGANAAANTGAGGGGGPAGSGQIAGAGGASGGACIAYINTPASSIAYAVGAGGGGGAAGSGGATFAGGNGAPGIIIIREFY